MLNFLFLFIVIYTQTLAAAELEVLAIEYPPYTTRNQSDQGIAFRLLRQYLADQPEIRVKPRFLPPARVQLQFSEIRWCGSFYPPPAESGSRFFPLSAEPLKIGLYHRQDDPHYNWQTLHQLKGYRVALLRNLQTSVFNEQFQVAGIRPVFVDTVIQGMRMLQQKRVDAALGDEHLQAFLSDQWRRDLPFRFSTTALITTPIGIHLNPQCPLSRFFR
ncbi:hypothetical protein [Neptuniibacter halophilus]|uniref:hypothetical protein n=1 Tax=Neptuniibacter halophilus TaxID=651666 RepID=UPI0025738BA7|nr:hypothetical protein [Neptuniibacter halophilus]